MLLVKNVRLNTYLFLSLSLSQRLYDSIKTEPFQVHEGVDDLTQVFFNPDHEGYLVKEGMCYSRYTGVGRGEDYLLTCCMLTGPCHYADRTAFLP